MELNGRFIGGWSVFSYSGILVPSLVHAGVNWSKKQVHPMSVA